MSLSPASPQPSTQEQEQTPFAEDPSQPPGVKYVCGDCGEEHTLRRNDPVRCRRCGFRIMYKVRTKKLIQFEAR